MEYFSLPLRGGVMSSAEVSILSLRPLAWALPFLPTMLWWLSQHPALLWLAPFFSLPWFALAGFLAPVHAITEPVIPTTLPALLPYLIYSGLLALGLDLLLHHLARRPSRVQTLRRRTVTGLYLVVALLSFAYLTERYATWRDWPPRSTRLPDALKLWGFEAENTQDVRVYERPGGFLDREYLVRLRVDRQLLGDLRSHPSLQPMTPDQSLSSFWGQPPFWWNPADGLFLRTAHFDFNDRGPDGDHGLLLLDEEHLLVHLWLKSNF